MLTPLLAAGFESLGHGSLVVLRLPAVVSVVAAAWLTGMTARELGGGSRAQVLATLAVAFWLPGVVWQAQHGWPQVELARMIRAEYSTAGERIGFLALQLVLFSLGATVLWVTGAVRLVRDPRRRFARVLTASWLVTFVVFVVTAGQGYYTAGTYPALIAAGAVVVERRAWTFWAAGVVVTVSSLMVVPAVLPVLPPTALAASGWAGLGEQQLEMVGWPREVRLVADVYRSIRSPRRPHAVILTANYGEAGAIDRYRARFGLPAAYSGLNGFGLWGPPPASARPVVLVWEDPRPPSYLRGCRFARRVGGPVPNEERDYARLFLCAGPRGSWASVWPRVAHLSN